MKKTFHKLVSTMLATAVLVTLPAASYATNDISINIQKNALLNKNANLMSNISMIKSRSIGDLPSSTVTATPATDTVPAAVYGTVYQTVYNGEKDTISPVLKSEMQNISEFISGITANYADTIDEKALKIGALKGMLQSLDPYSEYFTPQEFTDFKQMVNNETGGIGVQISTTNNKYVIQKVFDGSPAKGAGIKVGDIIVGVDGTPINKFKTLEDATVKMRGTVGTKVTIQVLRAGVKKSFTMTRQTIELPSVDYGIVTGHKDIGYVAVTQIAIDTYNQFQEAEKYFKANKIKKVILDLRDNGGGYMNVALGICRDIIPKGKIASIKYMGGQEEDIEADPNLTKAPFNFAVLINKNTASAAEFIAGAIQDRGIGILVGEKSYGKSVVQGTFAVNTDSNGHISVDFDGNYDTDKGNTGSVKLTIGKYYTPRGRFINKVGLKPSVAQPYFSVYQYSDVKDFDLKQTKKIKFKNGLKSPVVKSLEQKLSLLGFMKAVDDKYDQETSKAILNYQKSKKLKIKNGTVNDETLKSIDNSIKTLSREDLQVDKAITVLK